MITMVSLNKLKDVCDVGYGSHQKVYYTIAHNYL